MKSLAQYTKNRKKKEVRVRAYETTYWCSSIDDSIKELRRIKKDNKGHDVEMELEEGHGYYSDSYPTLGFYIRREETQAEFDKRMKQEYEFYVRNEERDIETYERMKKKFEA